MDLESTQKQHTSMHSTYRPSFIKKKEKTLVLIQVSSLSEARVHLIHERKENNLWAKKSDAKKQKKDSMKPFDEVKNDSMDSKTGGREGNHSKKQRFYTVHTVSFKLEMY